MHLPQVSVYFETGLSDDLNKEIEKPYDRNNPEFGVHCDVNRHKV